MGFRLKGVRIGSYSLLVSSLKALWGSGLHVVLVLWGLFYSVFPGLHRIC